MVLQIYLDKRAGTTPQSRFIFVIVFMILPIICSWGIWLLASALLIDIPAETELYGLDKQMTLAIITLAIGLILCLYTLISMLYVLINEFPRQVVEATLDEEYLWLTPIIGRKTKVKFSNIESVPVQKTGIFFHSPFSYSTIDRGSQYSLPIKDGPPWLMVQNIAIECGTAKLLAEHIPSLNSNAPYTFHSKIAFLLDYPYLRFALFTPSLFCLILFSYSLTFAMDAVVRTIVVTAIILSLYALRETFRFVRILPKYVLNIEFEGDSIRVKTIVENLRKKPVDLNYRTFHHDGSLPPALFPAGVEVMELEASDVTLLTTAGIHDYSTLKSILDSAQQ